MGLTVPECWLSTFGSPRMPEGMPSECHRRDETGTRPRGARSERWAKGADVSLRWNDRQVPELGKRVQQLLDASRFTLCTSEVVEVSHAEEDKGAKLLIRLQDGQMVRPPPTGTLSVPARALHWGRAVTLAWAEAKRQVETVIITHTHASSGRRRHTVCVSSQVRAAVALTLQPPG